MPPPLIWYIYHIIVVCLSPIVTICVLNHSHRHWLLSNALLSTIFTSLKLKEKNELVPSFDNLM